MPLYLDDLKVIQEQVQEMGRFINGIYDAYVISDGFSYTQHTNNGSLTYRVPDCTFLVDGELYTMKAADNLPPDPNGKHYIHLMRTPSEERIFSHGDRKACHETLTAEFLSGEQVYKSLGPLSDDELETKGYYNVGNIVTIDQGNIT